MGRDDLFWLHMLGEICRVAANACSSPLGVAPAASDFSAWAWNNASVFRLRVTVVLATVCLYKATASSAIAAGP